jgi:hypothetical protein
MTEAARTKLQYVRYVLVLSVTLLLVGCSARTIVYRGTCAQQTQQFMDFIYSLAREELSPVISEGLNSGPTADVMRRFEELNTRINELSTPACNPRTDDVKEALLFYMLETRNYFMIVAGRGVYGEGPVQAQLTKMSEAGLAFEIALEDLRK